MLVEIFNIISPFFFQHIQCKDPDPAFIEAYFYYEK